jgi:MYXO-CTERM domain-containing protein
VVTAAANEAGGQGFVTELAGSTAIAPNGLSYRETLYPEVFRVGFEALAAIDWSRRFGDLLVGVVNAYGQFDGIREAIADAVPLPPRTTVGNVLACPSCYADHFNRLSDLDPAALLAAVRLHVFQPLEETAALFDEQPYLTRLYTTMSADEMTVDPMFDFNAELGDHSSQHVAQRVTECGQGTLRTEAPWRVELANGQVVRGRGFAWPLRAGSMPANARTIRLGTTGEGDVVEDHASAIEAALGAHNSTISGPTRRIGGGGACSATSVDSTWTALVALAAATLRRRRR